mmetsp:Transcript_11783/g.11720  ORF Transcript_11783/g.11720 Transcript_11783/m.11720 type:complete len:104 (+) Transcript_11783:296-607(+)
MSLVLSESCSEIVLNRGVGLHTLLGISIDLTATKCVRSATSNFLHYMDVLSDKAAQAEFIKKYNKNALESNDLIPEDYFGFLEDESKEIEEILELLARYGDPS